MARWIIALAALTCLSLPSTAHADKTGADLRVVLWGG